uniref:Uncharacterized protein n=1 Tax=Rhipicephalus zambeziensis TaxID=60191 RepID=A0A224YFI7_9ACAR
MDAAKSRSSCSTRVLNFDTVAVEESDADADAVASLLGVTDAALFGVFWASSCSAAAKYICCPSRPSRLINADARRASCQSLPPASSRWAGSSLSRPEPRSIPSSSPCCCVGGRRPNDGKGPANWTRHAACAGTARATRE